MNNFKLKFIHICDYASISIGDKLNILGIFKNITSTIKPFSHTQFYIVWNIEVLNNINITNYKQYIKIYHKDDNKIDIKQQEVPVNKNTKNDAGFLVRFDNFQFNQDGLYKVEIWMEDLNGNREDVGESEIYVDVKV